MAIKKIPEKIIITCDRCGDEKLNKTNADYKKWSANGTVTFTCEGLDYSGAAVGPGDACKLIFCNTCYDKVVFAIRQELFNGSTEEAKDEQR